MLKRILVTGVILAATMQMALANTFYVAPGLVLNDITSKQNSFRGLEPRLTLGYAYSATEEALIGAEIFGTLGNIVLQDNRIPGTNSLHISRDYGMSLLPGFKIGKDVAAYARIGFVASRFSTGDKTRLGGQIGGGLEAELTDCMDIRGEYVFTAYRSLSAASGSPRGDSYALSLVRRFG